MFRKFRANAEPRVTNLANNIGVAADETDFLVFAKTHFAQAAGDFGRSGNLFDANGHPSFDMAEWKKTVGSCRAIE